MESLGEWDSPQPKVWGVSPPRSLSGPMDADRRRTLALEKFLDNIGASENEDTDTSIPNDATTTRCIDVPNEILQLVPNVQVFQTSLSFVMHWAKRRGVYSNETGFLGGIEWALLVARICQAHPNAVSSMIVFNFFDIYDGWCWPTPVMLDHITGDRSLGLEWDPVKNLVDKSHIMPIISPVYPCKNLNAEVSIQTLSVVQQQMKLANRICKTMNIDAGWHELCQPFLDAYSTYLYVKIIANDNEDFKVWNEWIKLLWRELPSKIEFPSSVLRCHLYPHEYVNRSGGLCAYHFIGLSRRLEGVELGAVRVPGSVLEDFKSAVHKYKLMKHGMTFNVAYVRKGEIGRLGLAV